MRESNEDLVIVSLRAASDPQLHCKETTNASRADETLCDVLEKVGLFPLADCILSMPVQVSSLFKENLVCKRCALVFHRPFTCVHLCSRTFSHASDVTSLSRLRDCGHMFCFSCIRALFSRAVYDRMVQFRLSPGRQEDITPHTVQRHISRMVELGIGVPEYQCPMCGCLIESRPVTAFILKNIIQEMGDVTQLLFLPDEE